MNATMKRALVSAAIVAVAYTVGELYNRKLSNDIWRATEKMNADQDRIWLVTDATPSK